METKIPAPYSIFCPHYRCYPGSNPTLDIVRLPVHSRINFKIATIAYCILMRETFNYNMMLIKTTDDCFHEKRK